ncbi:Putative esterase [Cupriavidus taiwanensis]|uniref:Esterase n=1 Tax=Cupriavidus taiwanensis TaxID=164546 RepID=A0A976AZH7_9BURK|nr:esterase [Cupriavidus taiwanensis]SOZ61947.1 Putative esterase [Cupriavidus taiwanensis]SOZ62188.1 Putative esterase [Cupriavidus taiwanensis]SOZ66219.1 Putative esterase [Cupriavidus taiwanensis]SPA07477.1 Putative esterase [Cupriavidus taiwanensis]
MLDPSLFGRMSFAAAAPQAGPLPPGRHPLGVAEERDAVLFVPDRLASQAAVPLMVMFHGAGGFPEKVLPHLEAHAQRHKFLVLAPHSLYPTWDIVIGGNGPDLQRLHQALTAVTSRYRIDPQRLAFAGFSDGASYALSLGLTNGDIASHVIAFSGGFMSVFMQTGIPKVFVAHGLADEQLPIASGRAHAARLRAAGYDVEYVEFDGPHVIHAPVVERAIDFFLQ